MSSVNKGRSKYRFNIVDVLLLLIIVVSVGAILFLYFFDGSGADDKKSIDTVDVVYTVSQTDVPDILRGKINIGDSVTAEEGKILMGQVIDVEYTDAKYSVFDTESNSAFEELYPGKIDVKIRISANAVVDEKGICRINGYPLNLGKNIELRFPYYTGNTVCVSVSEVNK